MVKPNITPETNTQHHMSQCDTSICLPMPDKNSSVTILICDDSSVNRYVIRRFLEKDGYAVIETANGLEALNALSTYKFDLILLDLQMPIMDGITFASKVQEANIDIPIIGVTGHVDEESINKCKDVGIRYVIPKPVDRSELLYRIENMLNISPPK